jgi:hypothetical protein
MTECFTLVLGDMFYVHYITINGLKYETVEKRRIYPIFQAIYGSRTDVFTNEILEEVIRASCTYGLLGSDEGFINLYLKYHTDDNTATLLDGLEDFKKLLESFRDKYDYYLIQDLKWTMNNAAYMSKHKQQYEYLNEFPEVIKMLNIVTLDSLDWQPCKYSTDAIEYFIGIGLQQLFQTTTNLMETSETLPEPYGDIIGARKKRYLRWSLGQLAFFEHYKGIPLVDGYRQTFHDMVRDIYNSEEYDVHKYGNFRYQWDYLMVKCAESQIITEEEAAQFKEVFPIFDPNYISSYDDKTENLGEVMADFLNRF